VASFSGDGSKQVFGVEIDSSAYSRTLATLRAEFGIGPNNLMRCDFFELEPAAIHVDAVVGNPPFIRYQRFSGETRRLGLTRAKTQGVRLSELASSWAPFLVHAISMVKPGGRLAMVIPFEITHAGYARPVLRHLAASFGSVTFLTFQSRIFGGLNEDTLLLLADNKGAEAASFAWRDLADSEQLLALLQTDSLVKIPSATVLDHNALCRGEARLLSYMLPEKVRSLYNELKRVRAVRSLGRLASVGIGYVTGANDYFHVGPSDVKKWKIPCAMLKPAVRRGRVLSGLRFTRDDWEAGLTRGDTGYLLHIDGARVPAELIPYLERGVGLGIPKAYKCRTRAPWYRVPHVICPDAILTYMSGARPKLVANSAQAVAPNTLHIVRIVSDYQLSGDRLAALWQTSLTGLSVEIEGHALGGGMLKLEPSEARNVLIALDERDHLRGFETELDTVYRTIGIDAAREMADREILRKGIGLSENDCRVLRLGIEVLVTRRCSK
jgi:adenine-specific DNA methylase